MLGVHASLGTRHDMVVADAGELAAPGEVLSFMQLQRRAQSQRAVSRQGAEGRDGEWGLP